MNRVQKGNNFEREVANIYEYLGYSIKTNAHYNGQQIDVIAEKYFSGIGNTKLLIECKYKENSSVSNQEVYDFISMYNSLQKVGKFTKGIFVTNNKYSKNCYEIGINNGDIELLTFDELENQLLDLKETFYTFKRNYENNFIFEKYIYQEAIIIDKDEVIPNLHDKLTNSIFTSKVMLYNILGDYGMGKTTLLEKIKYHLIDLYLKDNNIRLKPIVIQLKNFQLANKSIDQLLRLSILKEFKREIPLDVFWRMAKKGEFVFLLDGFDEMAPKISKDIRIGNYVLLSKFFTSGSKTLITCRPSYFVSNSEFNKTIIHINNDNKELKGSFKSTKSNVNKENKRLIDSIRNVLFNKFIQNVPLKEISDPEVLSIKIKHFDDLQINKYLKKFDAKYIEKYGINYKAIKKRLSKIYDLRDLMSQPILLEMINETILVGNIFEYSKDGQLSHSNLYDIYVKLKLEVDWDKGETRKFLTKKQRLQLAQSIALSMLKKNELEITYFDIIEIVEDNDIILNEIKSKLKNATIEEIVSDIQTTAFLIREQDGVFRFGHKSIMEFLVSLYIKEQIEKNIHTPLLEKQIPNEILYFLGGFGITEPKIQNKLIEFYKNPKSKTNHEIYGNNLIAAILHSGNHHKNLKIKNGNVEYIKNKVTSIEKGKFVNFVLNQSVDVFSLDDSLLSNFHHTCISNKTINIKKTKTVNSSYLYSATSILFDDLTTNDSEFKLHCENTIISNSTFSNSILNINNLDSKNKVEITDSTFERCKIFLNENYNSNLKPFSTNVYNNCTIVGMILNDKQYLSSSFNNCKGFIIIKEPFNNIPFGIESFIRFDDLFLIRESTLYNKEKLDFLIKQLSIKVNDYVGNQLKVVIK